MVDLEFTITGEAVLQVDLDATNQVVAAPPDRPTIWIKDYRGLVVNVLV